MAYDLSFAFLSAVFVFLYHRMGSETENDNQKVSDSFFDSTYAWRLLVYGRSPNWIIHLERELWNTEQYETQLAELNIDRIIMPHDFWIIVFI